MRTHAYPEDLSPDGARALWMERPPAVTVVAVDGDTVLGSAKAGPNRPGRGVGRALGEHRRAQVGGRGLHPVPEAFDDRVEGIVGLHVVYRTLP